MRTLGVVVAAAALISVVVIDAFRQMNCRGLFHFSYEGTCGVLSAFQIALLILAIVGGAVVVATWGRPNGAVREDSRSDR